MTLSRHVDRPARPHQRRTVRAGSAGALAFAIALGGVGVASAASPVDVPVAGAKTISKPHSSRISVSSTSLARPCCHRITAICPPYTASASGSSTP